mgnify:CR=1 FL=1
MHNEYINVTNIKAADGTSSLSIANSTGVITTSAGFNNYVAANFSAGSTTINPTLTDIPSWANQITVSFFDLSGSSTTDTFHRVAVGGSVITSGYQYISGYYQNSGVTISDRSGSGDAGFAFYGWTNALNNFSGTVTYTKVSNHKYVVRGQHYNHHYSNYHIEFSGRISLSGHISGISLYNSTNFDAGEVRVIWS